MIEHKWRDRFDEIVRGRWAGPDEVLDIMEKAAVQLGREMADERAEEIATAIRAEKWAHPASVCVGLELAASIAFIPKPKTREQVLEEALRSVLDQAHAIPPEAYMAARRALERKP